MNLINKKQIYASSIKLFFSTIDSVIEVNSLAKEAEWLNVKQ